MKISLFGLAFAGGDAASVLAEARAVASERPRQVVTANVDHVVTLSEQPRFRAVYARAAARTLDGMPLVWLSRLRGARAAQRITGHDLLAAVLADWSFRRERVFLVCASETAGRRLSQRFVNAGFPPDYVAYAVPPRGFENDLADSLALRARIRGHRTTLLLMGVGAPKSEIWVDRQGEALGNPLVLNIGEALNVAAALVLRAPVAMQRLGLEWLFRFGTQPRRLFRRYFIRSWRFLYLAARDRDLGSPAA